MIEHCMGYHYFDQAAVCEIGRDAGLKKQCLGISVQVRVAFTVFRVCVTIVAIG